MASNYRVASQVAQAHDARSFVFFEIFVRPFIENVTYTADVYYITTEFDHAKTRLTLPLHMEALQWFFHFRAIQNRLIFLKAMEVCKSIPQYNVIFCLKTL